MFSEVCVFVQMHPKTRIWQLPHHNCAHLKVSQSSCINNLFLKFWADSGVALSSATDVIKTNLQRKIPNFWDALEFPENISAPLIPHQNQYWL